MGDVDRGGGLRLVLLGPPNSGKGTQAQRIAAAMDVPAVSTGDMLRRAVAEGSALGRRVKETLDAGELVDDATMAELVRDRLSRPDTAGGYVLDGYPRTLAQAETLAAILDEGGESLDAAVLMDVDEDELVARALARGRTDDREEVLRERFRVYRERTEPLIGYYERLDLLHEVDGVGSIGEVTRRIFAALGVEGGVAAGADGKDSRP